MHVIDCGSSWFRGFILVAAMTILCLGSQSTVLASANAPLSQWPDPPSPKVSADVTSIGDQDGWYHSTSGTAWRNTLNSWYQQGIGAGLVQDTYCSYDNNHASITQVYYPQLPIASCVGDYTNATANIYDRRISFGNQSYGAKGTQYFEYYTAATIEYNFRSNVYSWYKNGSSGTDWLSFYQGFYENNFFFIAPACDTNALGADKFTFLTPYYMHSVGVSSSDCTLMRSFLYISAAMPPALKTRILRKGLEVPTIMYLFKKSFTGDIKSPDGHIPTWSQPAEALNTATSTPQLDRMLNGANGLTHIPPVAKFTVQSATFSTAPGTSYSRGGYYRSSPYAMVATLRQNEKIVVTLDLSSSIADDGYTVSAYSASFIRGGGTIEYLNPQRSQVRITIPWRYSTKQQDLRTDVLLTANDGTYDSAPAYVSVYNIQAFATGYFGLASYPTYVDPVRAYIFYNNSAFDGNDPAANAADDAAIATDKTALRPEGTATFANYTSYSRGINGIMFDIPSLPGILTTQDFTFKSGATNTPSQWTTARSPSITVRKGAGYNGTDRVTLIWQDGQIVDKWLQVTVKATANTGIFADDVFYFGNAVAETGNSSSSAAVNSSDLAAVRADPHKTFANPAGITNACDINRDKKVSTADEVITRENFTTIVTEFPLISVP